MQLQSTLSRFAAFVLFMLSFSMLACAAPAPVAAPGALVARGSDLSSNALVARTDVSDTCHEALLDLDAHLDIDIDLLSKLPRLSFHLFYRPLARTDYTDPTPTDLSLIHI